jgi:flagellar hook-basal body complex protein FliE
MKLPEITNSIVSINKTSFSDSLDLNKGLVQNKDKGQSFANLLKTSVKEVNQSQVTAYETMSDIATGKVENLQEAVKRIGGAELSLKLGLEVKNKALGAYKQVMAMQV